MKTIETLTPPVSKSHFDQNSETDSSTSCSPLPSDTLALLDSFYAELAISNEKMKELADEASIKLIHSKELQVENIKIPKLSVDEFRALFGEDWQLSQFWYSSKFANELIDYIKMITISKARIAFICSPTAYVAFNYRHDDENNSVLFEFDKRFELIAGKNFVYYDLDEPERIPDELKGKFDLAVVDPPFLNEITNKKLAITLEHLLNPSLGRLLLITSTSVPELVEIYAKVKPLKHLVMLKDLEVEHAGGLANNFAAWSS